MSKANFNESRKVGVELVSRDASGNLLTWRENGYDMAVARDASGNVTTLTASGPAGSYKMNIQRDAKGNYIGQVGDYLASAMLPEIIGVGGNVLKVSTSSDGGVIYDDAGVEWVRNPITGILRVKRAPEGVNSLIKTPPTVRLAPVSATGTLNCATVGTAAFSVSDVADPITGSKMLKIVVPAGDNTVQQINFFNLAADQQFAMGSDDIWFMAMRVEADVTAPSPTLALRVSTNASISGTAYRQIVFSADQWRPGTNVMSCLNVETLVESTTYNTLGTSVSSVWAEGDGSTAPTSTLRSVSLRLTACAGMTIYIGAVATAKPGWAKAIYVWEADDVPLSFWELAIPELEKRKIPATLNIVPGYMRKSGYMSRDNVREAIRRGHEISGHAWFHENSVSDSAIYANSLAQARRFWLENGIETAAKTMAWVQTDHNAAARQMALDAGIQFARGASGRFGSLLCPTAGPRCLPSNSSELSNSWQFDAILNGAARRSQIVRMYQHTTVPGGEGTPNYPEAVKHYLAHFVRWSDRAYEEQKADNAVNVTWTDAVRLCGLDPMRGYFPD